MSSRSQSMARTATPRAATPRAATTEECFILEVAVPWFTRSGAILVESGRKTYERYADAREDASLYEECGCRVGIRQGVEILYRTHLRTWSGPPPAGRSGLGRALMEAAPSNV